MKKKATEIVFGVLGTAAPRALIEAVAEAMADVASAANARAETAERDLAALRRRVEEAAREDTTEVATIRAATAFPEVIKSYDAASVLHVLRALDATRAAAGELRAALERIASWDDNAPTGSDRRTFDFWKETVRELGLIARNALKEPTP